MEISLEKLEEFEILFEEFIDSYLYTAKGLKHTQSYPRQRESGQRNYQGILEAKKAGEDITDRVLLQLLPYRDTKTNREQGAWIHIAPAINKDLKVWVENSRWTKSEDWYKVADLIFIFINHCVEDSESLSLNCQTFYRSNYSKGLQTGFMTPILNAIKPDDFLLINNKSRTVINYFLDTKYSHKLIDYPAINKNGKQLIKDLDSIIDRFDLPALPQEDIFDMFCHWLVVEKQYDFQSDSLEVTLPLVSDNPKKEIEEHLKIWNPKYKLEKYVDATYIEESQLKTWIKSITRKKQVIFYGSPGTGKTFIAENIAQYLIGGGDGFYELIQFHPAYSYEDFIQGIRPQTDSGQLSYSLVPGRFLEFCSKAANCQDKCILIIDEINRGNLAEIFGELMYLLEYREQEIYLAGSQDKFKIPNNVYLIGTMNTADRSIALVDFALRRRFAFIKIAPDYDIISKFHQQDKDLNVTGLIAVLQEINQLIENDNYYVGVSFFLTETLAEDLEDIWQMEIEPYQEEYFGDRLEEITDYRWKNIADRIGLPKKI